MAKHAESSDRPRSPTSSDYNVSFLPSAEEAGVEALPAYADVREGEDLQTTVLELAHVASAEGLELPITAGCTCHGINYSSPSDARLHDLRGSIVASFFDAITTKKDNVVALMIEHNLVTANTVNMDGQTPLAAAVTAKNVRMVQELLDFEASVDAFGAAAGDTVFFALPGRRPCSEAPQRTPLQLAASQGHLTLVKLLMEVYHADDALVAPDGQTALRLAATNGHREIVAYLPSRRGGEWRRWKTKHAVAMHRAHRAASVLWKIGRFFAWDIPKALLVSFARAARWCWKNRQRIGKWCLDQLIALPKVCATAAKELPRAVGHLLWEAAKMVPDLTRWILRVLKRLPHGMRITIQWLWDGLVTAGKAVGSVFGSLVSLLHTIFAKLVDFLGNITLTDVWEGICRLLQAIFIEVPRASWHWLKKFGEMSYEALKATFGTLGQIVWWLGCAILALLWFVPARVGDILLSFAESITKAWEELLVWIDPKR